jgi:hypothetical protein
MARRNADENADEWGPLKRMPADALFQKNGTFPS